MDNKLDGTEILEASQSNTTARSELSTQEYVNITESSEYKALKKKKNKFIFPIAVFFLLFYFALPVLTSFFPSVLKGNAIGDITWVWIFAFAQFIMVWTLVTVYVKKAAKFDKDAAVIIHKAKDGAYK
ncbi:DUF485 domain-containing protein [Kurthia sibirica]|uniref:DUF485 domain-containing protein n=1 Tax=Kurthia sibirica TaxID=202750 RepID=A0A2U3AN34_9BACL|nr:DUF485 domain-containing protein [Kurthia sibirica]PWI25953.1 DUF485 domain-containing protein [Kurthia sibirica]GEK35158.1 membrane protein [Kurthia sibirica]